MELEWTDGMAASLPLVPDSVRYMYGIEYAHNGRAYKLDIWELTNGKYEIRHSTHPCPLIAGPFDTLEAAKAAYLLIGALAR